MNAAWKRKGRETKCEWNGRVNERDPRGKGRKTISFDEIRKKKSTLRRRRSLSRYLNVFHATTHGIQDTEDGNDV